MPWGMGVTSKSPAKASSIVAILLAVVLTLLAVPAWALGLGQLQVKSAPGQPLVAEIPIISGDPSELENLQARLASPETFRRVGLQPPGTEVRGLQFSVALDSRGNPVIRVTSVAPLQQPQLTFLLEVDWGEGRLVREYSALVDVPRTVAAPIQPVQAPTVAPSNTIVRAPTTVSNPPQSTAAPATPQAAAAPPPANAITPTAPAPRPATPVPAPTAPSIPGDYRVRTGDTLSQIAAGVGQDGHSLAQTMLALLRANPEAFIGDNINLVKAGAVLRMPRGEELSQYSKSEAATLVRTQIAQWRQMQAPQRQPDAVAQTEAGNAGNADNGNGNGNRNNKAAPGKTGARLEIVPPSSGDGKRAGTRSGIAAGGEGDMERQQLQQTKETLAARDAEVSELKSRVAELEKVQDQQQQLIQMKDSALAAAQQDLAKSNATQATTQQPEKAADGGTSLWLWGGLLLLVAALVAWLLMRGRRDDTPVRRRFDASGFGLPGPVHHRSPGIAPGDDDAKAVEERADEGTVLAGQAHGDASDVDTPASQPHDPQPHWTAAPTLVGTAPAWHAGDPMAGDAQHAEAGKPAQANDAESPARQIELARAYLDLGDDDAARALLLEALDGRDPGARETAARMLRDL